MKRALVTGGAGFIGSHLVTALLNEEYFVRVFDDFSTGKLENVDSRAEVIKGDVRNLDELFKASEKMNYIFHLAAKISVAESMKSYGATHDVNVGGTANVCTVASELFSVQKIIFASSCAVYGDHESPLLSEIMATNPLSPYAVSKLKGERILIDGYQERGLRSICLRYFNVYGPRQSADLSYAAVIPKFIDCALKNINVTIYGKGVRTRDFIHVDDVVRANLLAIEYPQFGIFNVGTGCETSVNQLWDIIKSETNTLSEAVYDEKTRVEISHSCADTSLAKAELEFVANTKLVDGIKFTMARSRVKST